MAGLENIVNELWRIYNSDAMTEFLDKINFADYLHFAGKENTHFTSQHGQRDLCSSSQPGRRPSQHSKHHVLREFPFAIAFSRLVNLLVILLKNSCVRLSLS